MKTITIDGIEYALVPKAEPVKQAKQWEPQGGMWFVGNFGDVQESPSDEPSRLFGIEYLTQEAAQKARDAMRTHNRLLAYVAEFDAGWEADWSDDLQTKFAVCYHYENKRWLRERTCTYQNAGTVYMSEHCAKGLVEKLNSGEVVL